MDHNDGEVLQKTPLHQMHVSRGAKMVPFSGWDMPLNYPTGILQEHRHTRAEAGLFDVSHMGQVLLRARSGNPQDAALALARLVPVDVSGLAEGRQRYGFFTSSDGGILDDLMIANRGDHIVIVVNAACRGADLAHLEEALGETCQVEMLDRALLALQGPKAAEVLARLHPDVGLMRFMDVRMVDFQGCRAVVSRSGYTGEDGFEISLEAGEALDFAGRLLAHSEVELIGLGARDSLRLEAGLCLHGQDIDAETTPVEAALEWAIQPARRAGGARAGGFPGAERILAEIERGPARRRVGLLPEGRAPMRAGTELLDAEEGNVVGNVTSGSFGPSLDAPVSMGYVSSALAEPDTRLFGRVRGRDLPVRVAKMPFIVPGYKRT